MVSLLIFVFLVMFSSLSYGSSPRYDDEEIDGFEEAMAKAAEDSGINRERLNTENMYMIPPSLSDEEEGSRHMPVRQRCSGCIAAAFQFKKGFAKAEKKLKKKGSRLPYADVLEVTEDVCENRLRRYGIKNVRGRRYLSGEGLKHDKVAGIMEAGGKWEVRLKNICGELIETFEEEGIYSAYVKRGVRSLDVALCSDYCDQEEMEDLENRKDEL